MIGRETVDRWLDAYVAAWRAWDRDAIAALFSEEATYRWHPYEEPVRGNETIAGEWLGDPDEPGGFEAEYETIAADGDTAVATGFTAYKRPDGSVRAVYDNCFVMRFDGDGRCREFVEYYVRRPD